MLAGSSQNTLTHKAKLDICLICNTANPETLLPYSHAHLVQCKNCGFVFCNKVPSVEELIAHYDTYPRNDTISSITIKRYSELLHIFESCKKTGNILDVGCGNGHFLAEAKKNGWKVYGTEYTDRAMEICRSKEINMFQGKLNPKDFGAIKFDVITSFEVLEHINNPQEEIQNFNQLLREGGVVYLTTPNFDSLSRYMLKEKWSIIEYPEHLCYYTVSTLNYLFKRSGFKKLSVITTGISLSRLQQHSNSTNETTVKKDADESLREKTESNVMFWLIKKMVNVVLTVTRKGDTLKGMFVKQVSSAVIQEQTI